MSSSSSWRRSRTYSESSTLIPLDRTLRSAKNPGCGRGADTVRASVGRSEAIESLATLIGRDKLSAGRWDERLPGVVTRHRPGDMTVSTLPCRHPTESSSTDRPREHAQKRASVTCMHERTAAHAHLARPHALGTLTSSGNSQ